MEIQIFLRKSHFHETANINNSSNKPSKEVLVKYLHYMHW